MMVISHGIERTNKGISTDLYLLEVILFPPRIKVVEREKFFMIRHLFSYCLDSMLDE